MKFIINWNITYLDRITGEKEMKEGASIIEADELDEDSADEVLEDWVMVPKGETNAFIELADEHYGHIDNFKVLSVEEFLFKPRRMSLSFKTSCFSKYNRWETKERLKEYETEFKAEYPSLRFLQFFSEEAKTELKNSHLEVAYILEFDLTRDIYEHLLENAPHLLEEETKIEVSELIDLATDKRSDTPLGDDLGTFAFLEGGFHMDEGYKGYVDDFKERGISFITVTDLYEHPERLGLLKKHSVENLIVKTTGVDGRLKDLIGAFIQMKFVPKNIFIIGSNNSGFDLNSVTGYENTKIKEVRK